MRNTGGVAENLREEESDVIFTSDGNEVKWINYKKLDKSKSPTVMGLGYVLGIGGDVIESIS